MKIRVLIGAWLLAMASAPVHPLGLGEILVNSRLNQPLDAEILVRENAPGEAERLVAKLAAQEDYARVGLERARLPVLLRFETGKNARGQTVIRVRSDEPVREPFLTLLVEANWSGGRLLREYGVLLDPPVAAPASRIARSAPPAAAPAQPATTQPLAETPPPAPAPAVEPAPAPVPAPAPARPTPAPVAAAPTPEPMPEPAPRSAPPPGFAAPPPSLPAPAAAPAAPAPAPQARTADGSYTVQRGDTLTGIASQFAAESGVGLNQMMVALQRENPRAFFADNINALKAGAVLRVPDAGSAELSSAEAAAEVRRQNESWSSARAPALADAGAAPTHSVTAAAPGSTDPRLELLPPAADAEGSEAAGRAGTEQGGAQMAETQAELQRAREDLRSRDQEMSELMSRVRDLEELNTKNARLIELKDAEVAELQRRLAEASAAAAAPAAVAEPTPDLAAAAPEADPAADPAVDPTAEPAADPATDPAAPGTMADAGAEPAAGDAITAADGEAAATADPLGAEAIDPLTADAADDAAAVDGDPALDPALDPAPDGDGTSEDDWAASATDSAADPFADADPSDATTPDTSAQPTPPPVDAVPAPATVQDAGTTTPAATTPWYMQPMVQGAALIGLALILLLTLLARRQRRSAVVEETPRRSVADLFNTPGATIGGPAADAGGSDEAAALQARIQANPDDLGAYLELLSLYYAEGDRDRFQHWAERMFEQPGAEESEEWDQVFGMGEELLPEHPLFAEDGEDGSDTDLDEGFERYEEPLPPPAEAAPPPPPRVVDIGGTDMRFESELDDVQDQDDDMPIEFERTSYVEPVSRPPVSAPAALDDDVDGADALPPLVFGDDDDDGRAPAPAPAAASPAQTGSDDGGLDDAATKLELARAYLDMGDPDGARAMLEEVLGEGDTSQREEARKLLATL
jgi:pilus assembly protein FimV